MVRRSELGDVAPHEISRQARAAAGDDSWARWIALGVAMVMAMVLSAVVGAAAGWVAAGSGRASDPELVREVQFLRQELQERLDHHARAIEALRDQQRGETK